jgi:hypothetical protein
VEPVNQPDHLVEALPEILAGEAVEQRIAADLPATRDGGRGNDGERRIFGFKPADDIEPLEIQFLAESGARIEASRTS